MPPGWALVVALLVVAVPWAVNAAFVMSEAAAYPVFLWAVLACHGRGRRARRRAGTRWRSAALALAFFTRPQFLFLAAVLPLAALSSTARGGGPAAPRAGGRLRAPRSWSSSRWRRSARRHRLLGDYGVTATQGSLLPAIAWKSAAIHVDVLAVGLGVVPVPARRRLGVLARCGAAPSGRAPSPP